MGLVGGPDGIGCITPGALLRPSYVPSMVVHMPSSSPRWDRIVTVSVARRSEEVADDLAMVRHGVGRIGSLWKLGVRNSPFFSPSKSSPHPVFMPSVFAGRATRNSSRSDVSEV
jgi:hypothetical protein